MSMTKTQREAAWVFAWLEPILAANVSEFHADPASYIDAHDWDAIDTNDRHAVADYGDRLEILKAWTSDDRAHAPSGAWPNGKIKQLVEDTLADADQVATTLAAVEIRIDRAAGGWESQTPITSNMTALDARALARQLCDTLQRNVRLSLDGGDGQYFHP